MIGIALQGLGMLLITMVATLVGLISLPLWVWIILQDLQWNQLMTSMREKIQLVRESKLF
jgi:uncharacterized membrane protein YjgN (DUF898 family)